MTVTKRKISVSLDEDLIAELESGGEALSGQINEAVRAEIERRRRRRLLCEFLDAMDAERGPVDEQLVSKYIRLLS
ncbi:MAG TPA: type II toxin-antitoxin system CcdA family antitoxin [Pseudonocardiaceae bacterium]|nr:type II toxin-antitoxin system CcdA family antitoxin [Pseudonocardiaceae bacterium]